MANNRGNITITFRQNNVNNALSDLRRKKLQILEAWGIKAVSIATSLITAKGAVDTGRLRASITFQKIGDNTMQLGTPVEYGKYVELGTSRMRKRPFILPAIRDNIDTYKSIAETILRS